MGRSLCFSSIFHDAHGSAVRRLVFWWVVAYLRSVNAIWDCLHIIITLLLLAFYAHCLWKQLIFASDFVGYLTSELQLSSDQHFWIDLWVFVSHKIELSRVIFPTLSTNRHDWLPSSLCICQGFLLKVAIRSSVKITSASRSTTVKSPHILSNIARTFWR